MWLNFVLAYVFSAIAIYSVGYCVLRTFLFSKLTSFCFAPIVSVFVYVSLGILYAEIGVASSWISIFLLPTVVLLILLSIRLKFLRKEECNLFSSGSTIVFGAEIKHFYRLAIALALLISIFLVVCFLLIPMGSPENFSCEWDNWLHLNLPVSFCDSGIWSILQVTNYPNFNDIPESYFAGTPGFYPAGWHIIVAIILNASGLPVTLCANAVNAVIISFVYPLSMLTLLSALFPDNKVIVLSGSLVCMLCEAFPWQLFSYGPLYPNLFSYAVLPLLLAFFINVFSKQVAIGHKCLIFIFILIGIATEAFLQPNAVFVAVVFLYPFCTYRLFSFIRHLKMPLSTLLAILACVMWSMFCVFTWNTIWKMPAFSGTLTDSWATVYTLPEAILRCLDCGLRTGYSEILLALLIIIGLFGLLSNSDKRWIAFSWAGLCLLFVVCTVFDTDLKRTLTGFWYSDSFRLAASVAIAAVPLCAYGFAVVIKFVTGLFKFIFHRENNLLFTGIASAAITLVCIGLVPFDANVTTALSKFSDTIKSQFAYTSDENILNGNGSRAYTTEEQQFVEDVVEIIGDSYCLNLPLDGSLYAYSVNGLNVLYRTFFSNGDYSTIEGLLRNLLSSHASSANVVSALKTIGVEYVLLLDNDINAADKSVIWGYDDQRGYWTGFESITDETVGFSVILARGDMRLYKIE